MGEFPRGKGVGGKALVQDREVGQEAGVAEVGIKGGELVGEEHSLVADRPGRERGAVKSGRVGGDAGVAAQGDFHLAPGDEQFALQLVRLQRIAGNGEDLADHRLAGADFGVDGGRVHGNIAPAEDFNFLSGEGLLHGGLGALAGRVVLGQEHHADGVLSRRRELAFGLGAGLGVGLAAGLVAGLGVVLLGFIAVFDFIAKDLVGRPDEHAGAVAGGGIGPDGPAVGEVLDDFHGDLHDAMRGGLAEVRDEADAAAVVFGGGVVKSVARGLGNHQSAILH